jgi:hypothetical protein
MFTVVNIVLSFWQDINGFAYYFRYIICQNTERVHSSIKRRFVR